MYILYLSIMGMDFFPFTQILLEIILVVLESFLKFVNVFHYLNFLRWAKTDLDLLESHASY